MIQGSGSEKAGQPPGLKVPTEHRNNELINITCIEYDAEGYNERQVKDIRECLAKKEKAVTWINVDGLSDVNVIEEVGRHYGLHPLIIEDILTLDQRPKLEEFEDRMFFILKMLSYNNILQELTFEQVSVVLTEDTVITFQERIGDVFNPIRERIRSGKGLIRRMGADYLVYALIDMIVDNYFAVLEKIGDEMEGIEDELVANPDVKTIQAIHGLKGEMITLRKSVWPLREIMSHLERCGSRLISESTGIYLRDVYDHTVQVIDGIETYRDILSDMIDIYLSGISNRMNEIMKVLTVVGTVFIPLTFIAGLYGMNFRYMPELDQWWGYPLTLLIMAATAGYMIYYFRKKKWL